jgi:hypothetical protein
MDMPEPEKNDTVAEASVIKTPGKVLLILALVLSLGPLTVGVSIFLLWWLTRSFIFESLGFYTILGGLISVSLAFITVIGYAIVALRAKESTVKVAIRAAIVLTVILINFPAALACLVGYDYTSSLYVLTVENKSSVTIQRVTVSGSCTTTNLGPISPGGKKHIKFYAESEGPLLFSVSSNDLKIDGVLDVGYATRVPGENTTLTIKDGGKYVVEGQPPFVD